TVILVSLCLTSLAAAAPEQAAIQAPQSATVLEFGGVDTLFVADSDGGQIFAYQLPKIANTQSPTDSKPFNLTGFSNRIADHFKVAPRTLRYHDLAVHPVTKDAYVSLSIKAAKGSPKGTSAAVV
ncbi:MAG: hypothetical protein AAFY88_31730, partial [Acidobacteriota bacterium]